MVRRIKGIIIAFALLTLAMPAAAVDKDGNFILVIDPGHGGEAWPDAVHGVAKS